MWLANLWRWSFAIKNESVVALGKILSNSFRMLVNSLSDRMADEDVAEILDFIDHNEWAVGYNLLIDRVYETIPISMLEYELICMLYEYSDEKNPTFLKNLKSQIKV